MALRPDRIIVLVVVAAVLGGVLYLTISAGSKSSAIKTELFQIYEEEGCSGPRRGRLSELVSEYRNLSYGLDQEVERVAEDCGRGG